MESQQTQNPYPRHPLVARKIITIIVGLAVLFLTFRSGYYFGNKGFVLDPKEFKIVNQNDQPADVDYGLLWKAIAVVNTHYIEKPVDPMKTLYGAIRGAVSAAGDQYTTFFDPEEYGSFKTSLKGSFDGIGAEIGKKNDQLVIIAPLDESPAKKAGLLAGDYILQVDGQTTQDWSVDEAVQKIRGNRGTEVTLTIYREGRTGTFDVKIKRDEIKVKSVKVEYKDQNGKHLAVITLSRFGDDTKQLFAQAVKDISSQKVDGIVLDLRNDPGGYLDTAVDVASYWVAKNDVIVTQESTSQDPIIFKSYGYAALQNIKTVVMINGGSASAAEILSGALKDHNIAKLIGEKSFGKGSVQEIVDLPGGSAVKVTVARWITPSGKHLNHDGLVPDIEVKRSEDDITNNKDPQMDKALEEVVK